MNHPDVSAEASSMTPAKTAGVTATAPCDTTLSEFAAETGKALASFVQGYEARHKENPERYPLRLPGANSGLWLEFFMDFCTSGTL